MNRNRSPEDLFVPPQNFDIMKLIMPIIILLLVGTIVYLLLKDNATANNMNNQLIVNDLEAVQKQTNQKLQPKPTKLIQKQTKNTILEKPKENKPNSNSNKMSNSDLEKLAQIVVQKIRSEQNVPQSLPQNTQLISNKNKQITHFNKVLIKNNENKITQQIDTLKGENYGKKKSNYIQSTAKEFKSRQAEMRYHTVQNGETLTDISMIVYGDAKYYKKIFSANPDILRNANLIYVGQKLRVPK